MASSQVSTKNKSSSSSNAAAATEDSPPEPLTAGGTTTSSQSSRALAAVASASVERGAGAEANVGGLEGLPDGMLIAVGMHLTATDLAKLEQSATRFAAPCISLQAGRFKLSVVREAGRLQVQVHLKGRLGTSKLSVRARTAIIACIAGHTKKCHRMLAKIEPFLAKFTGCGPAITLSENGAVATKTSHLESLELEMAISNCAVMSEGQHYCEFKLLPGCPTRDDYDRAEAGCVVGIVSKDGTHPQWGFRVTDSNIAVPTTAQGGVPSSFELLASDVSLGFASWYGAPSPYDEQLANCGDTVGLLLDLDEGSLALYVNGRRIGFLIPFGLRDVTPFRWGVDLSKSMAVRMQVLPPPKVSQEERAWENQMITEALVAREYYDSEDEGYDDEELYHTWTGDETYSPMGEPW